MKNIDSVMQRRFKSEKKFIEKEKLNDGTEYPIAEIIIDLPKSQVTLIVKNDSFNDFQQRLNHYKSVFYEYNLDNFEVKGIEGKTLLSLSKLVITGESATQIFQYLIFCEPPTVSDTMENKIQNYLRSHGISLPGEDTVEEKLSSSPLNPKC